MNTFRLYSTWNQLLGQWLTDTCRTRRANLVWLIVGLYLGGRVQASAIVKHWGVQAKVASLTRRLSRWLDNGAVRPAVWYRPVARRLLADWGGSTITLIIDATRVSAGRQLVMVALAYRQRALPVAWTWVKYAKGHVTSAIQGVVLKRVAGLVPENVAVILVGDAGFGSVGLMRAVMAWGWQYVLRQTGKHLLHPTQAAAWQRLDTLLSGPGQHCWLTNVQFTRRWEQTTHVCAYWAAGETDAWLLTTNLPDACATRRAYARRMWIEAMFGDWKGHGWDLETTHLRHPDRLSRLVLALALLYVWLVLYGTRVIRAGWRAWVDRRERRDLSIFRIGLDVLQRCLTLACEPPLPLPSLVGAASVR
jgi:hypothetical protein